MIIILVVHAPIWGANGRFNHSSNSAKYWFDLTETIDPQLVSEGINSLLSRNNLKLQREYQHGKRLIRSYQQFFQGLPVKGAKLEITQIDGKTATLSHTWLRSPLEFQFQIKFDENQALNIALSTLKIKELRDQIRSKLVLSPEDGSLIPCWEVRIPAKNPLGDWEVLINAGNGEIVSFNDHLLHFNGSGLVFNPDPVTATRNSELEDDDDNARGIPENAYSEVELLEISQDDEEFFVLSGPWVDTEPTENRIYSEELEFFFDRSDDHFEEVMAYFHIDNHARYLINLGFDELPPSPQLVEVNGVEEDMSFYSPFTGIITTGTGGVDDAEDADVLIHEYGHALINQVIEDWTGGEEPMLNEGLCDYFAGDYSLFIDSEFQNEKIYNWDGHNEFWEGRILNSDLKYSEIDTLGPHEAGQMWSSLLIEVRNRSTARDDWNHVVIDHLALLGDSLTVPDAAESLLQSDLQLKQGYFRNLILSACESREIFPRGFLRPQLSHRPLNDTEDLDSDRDVIVQIISEIPLDSDRLWLIWGNEDGEIDTVHLESEGDSNFIALIPGAGQETDVGYYLVATDTTGAFSMLPESAPLVGFRYHVGPDRLSPYIQNVDSLTNTVFESGNLIVSAIVQDNIEVQTVSVQWFNADEELLGRSEMIQDDNDPDYYTGRMNWELELEENIYYQIRAEDSSQNRNVSLSRMRHFSRQRDAVLDDFENHSARWDLNGWFRMEGKGRSSSFGLIDRMEPDSIKLLDASAMLDEEWDLTNFGRFRLFFWERHQFDQEHEEYGIMEISNDHGDSWEELLAVEGSSLWWTRKEVSLDRFSGGQSPPVKIRWKRITTEDVESASGWQLDNLFISTDVVVSSEVEIKPKEFILVDLYPNPTNGLISLTYNFSEQGQLRLFDINGREMLEMDLKLKKGYTVLNLNHFPAGTYILHFQNNHFSRNKQILLLK